MEAPLTYRNCATFLAIAALCAAVPGCATDADLEADPPDGGGADAGPGEREDFGGARATPDKDDESPSVTTDAGATPGGDEDPAPPPYDGTVDDPKRCFNGEADEPLGGVDCASPSCFPLGSCCVGSGDCCEPVTGTLPGAVDLLDCVDASTTECRPFGDPLPWTETDDEGSPVLAPGGDARFDSGVVDARAVDTRVHRLALSAVFDPGASSCGLSCAESAGLGLTTRAPDAFGEATHVEPMVGLVLGGDRVMRLVVAGEVVDSFGADTEATWTLVVRPTGEVSVQRDGADVGPTRRFVPVSAAHLVLYGRTRNEGEGPRIGNVTVSTKLCDIPSAWTERDAITLTGGGPGAPRAPSLARSDDGRFLAFDDGDAIWMAHETDPATFEVIAGEPVVTGDGVPVTDPALHVTEDAAWLYYTSDGGAGIGRAIAPSPAGAFTVSPPIGLSAADHEGIAALEQPTVDVSFDGTWLLVARVTYDDESRGLLSFFSVDGGASWQRIDSGDLGARTRSSSQEGITADADELAQPTLHVYDRAWHLYYARRRGTRWSIGLMASEELVWWRPVEAEVLEASGQSFDRLGVSAPSALAARTDDASGGVDLAYVGHDGVQPSLGLAHRPASPRGTFGM